MRAPSGRWQRQALAEAVPSDDEREELVVMDDQEIVDCLRAQVPFRLLPHAVTAPARKYLDNGVFQLQGIFALIVLLDRLGVSQRRLVQLYRRLIRQGKL